MNNSTYIAPRFSGHPTISIYPETTPFGGAAHLLSGGQVTYVGSLVEHRGPFAVVGQCACDRCTPRPDDDDDQYFDRMRLVLTNGTQELVCVRPQSVVPR